MNSRQETGNIPRPQRCDISRYEYEVRSTNRRGCKRAGWGAGVRSSGEATGDSGTGCRTTKLRRYQGPGGYDTGNPTRNALDSHALPKTSDRGTQRAILQSEVCLGSTYTEDQRAACPSLAYASPEIPIRSWTLSLMTRPSSFFKEDVKMATLLTPSLPSAPGSAQPTRMASPIRHEAHSVRALIGPRKARARAMQGPLPCATHRKPAPIRLLRHPVALFNS